MTISKHNITFTNECLNLVSRLLGFNLIVFHPAPLVTTGINKALYNGSTC